ncbi:MAG TPA: SpoIIE family protein phosphatase, partial [Rhizomicrobium sp.]|nr:SpoIIE family protein phosphatase [Rhizomicrobium sp.]
MAWLNRRPARWVHLQHTPVRQMWKLVVGVTLLFSFAGFYADLMSGGTWPYAIALAIAVYSGLTAAAFVMTLARLPLYCALILGTVTFFGKCSVYLSGWIEHRFHPAGVPAETGVHFAATSILCAVSLSYVFLGQYMKEMGTEALRLRTELELAHSIQKTLVPPVTRTTPQFEVYGVSYPSEKVGGDLVDVVELPGGDTVAYLADIAGHGLQAGILMGMLKTAARMALADPDAADGGGVLSELMLRINVVLPQVKEAHMYATFTSLRLNRDGQSFYGMA